MVCGNNGEGNFTDVALTAGMAYTEDGKVFSGMGTVFADLDNHGLPDILTTSLPYEYYALFRNIGKGQFNYASVSTGLAAVTRPYAGWGTYAFDYDNDTRSEEHTSELQSHLNLVCRLLLEKKKESSILSTYLVFTRTEMPYIPFPNTPPRISPVSRPWRTIFSFPDSRAGAHTG